jgi:transposase
MSTSRAPRSVQQKSHELLLCMYFYNRRNWLFADTVKAAMASAALYSIVSTARANGLEPYAYLRRLFTEMPKAKTVEDFEAMLPFNTAPI